MITAAHIEVVVAEIGALIVGSGYARIEAAKPYLKHDNYAYLIYVYGPTTQRSTTNNYREP
jgi:hypothetical protein